MSNTLLLTKHNWKTLIILSIIICIALLSRIIYLSQIPNGLQLDELNAGYQGFKILTTGSDIFGNHLPLFINRFGDYRPGGIFYLAGLSTYIFGFSVLFIRLPVALIGAFTVIPLFFLTLIIARNRIVALLAAFLLAVSPWHIVASRATSESIVSLFFIISGVALLLYAIRWNKKPLFLFAFMSLIASYGFYHSPRLFLPVLLCMTTIFFYLYPKRFGDASVLVSRKFYLVVFLAVFAVTVGITFTKFGTGRFNQTSIFTNSGIQGHIDALEDVDHGNILNARIFHNKLVVFSKAVIDQYLSYFSVNFLYISGGLPDRYAVDDMGLFYYIELPLLLVGLYIIIRKKEYFNIIPLLWLLCGPVTAALTLEDSPNIQRSIFMLPSLQIIEAYGLYYFLSRYKPFMKGILTSIFLLVLSINIIYFFHMYFVHSPSHKSFLRNDGNKELFTYLSTQEKYFDSIYISSYEDLPMYSAFFQQDTKNLLSMKREQYERELHRGKYVFLPADCPETVLHNELSNKNKHILIIDSPICKTNSFQLKIINSIIRKDNTVAYVVKQAIW